MYILGQTLKTESHTVCTQTALNAGTLLPDFPLLLSKLENQQVTGLCGLKQNTEAIIKRNAARCVYKENRSGSLRQVVCGLLYVLPGSTALSCKGESIEERN